MKTLSPTQRSKIEQTKFLRELTYVRLAIRTATEAAARSSPGGVVGRRGFLGWRRRGLATESLTGDSKLNLPDELIAGMRLRSFTRLCRTVVSKGVLHSSFAQLCRISTSCRRPTVHGIFINYVGQELAAYFFAPLQWPPPRPGPESVRVQPRDPAVVGASPRPGGGNSDGAEHNFFHLGTGFCNTFIMLITLFHLMKRHAACCMFLRIKRIVRPCLWKPAKYKLRLHRRRTPHHICRRHTKLGSNKWINLKNQIGKAITETKIGHRSWIRNVWKIILLICWIPDKFIAYRLNRDTYYISYSDGQTYNEITFTFDVSHNSLCSADAPTILKWKVHMVNFGSILHDLITD